MSVTVSRLLGMVVFLTNLPLVRIPPKETKQSAEGASPRIYYMKQMDTSGAEVVCRGCHVCTEIPLKRVNSFPQLVEVLVADSLAVFPSWNFP